MKGSTAILAAGVGGVTLAAAGWAAQQRADRRAIQEDPKGEPLFAEFGGRRTTVAAEDGTQLAVQSFGPDDAPTIVLVHGWTCASQFWKLQIPGLSADRRVVAYDLRGHGDSERARSGDYSIQAFGSDLERVLSECVPEGERALLVGHSLGAMTVISWAGMHPELVDERVSAAVLVNAGVGDLVSESLVMDRIPDRLPRLQRAASEGVLRARAPLPAFSGPATYRLMRYAVVGPDASPAETAFCERLVLSCPASVRGAVGGTLSALDLQTALEQLRVPTLLIAGELDRLTPPRHAQLMAAALPDVLDVIEIPRSGHMSPVEFPDEVTGLLAKLAGSGAALHPAAAAG
jgi:pimeloyl-ACP methyl ester carboxylesterase